MPYVLSLATAPRHTLSHGAHFEAELARLAATLGAQRIGANVTRVPPGKAAFPFHHHHANEEHFFVLAGRGVLRIGAETHAVAAHDYVYCPPGGPEVAHQFVNTGDEDLLYLAFSTMQYPEVAGYPDAGKTSVRTAPGETPGARFLLADGHRDTVGYWDGEDGAAVAAIVDGADPTRP